MSGVVELSCPSCLGIKSSVFIISYYSINNDFVKYFIVKLPTSSNYLSLISIIKYYVHGIICIASYKLDIGKKDMLNECLINKFLNHG